MAPRGVLTLTEMNLRRCRLVLLASAQGSKEQVMAENISPKAGSAAERRAAWSLGLGLAGVVGTILVIAKIKLFTSSGYTLMWGAVGVLGLGALVAGVTAWSDGRFSGRAKLGIAMGTAVVVFFILVAMEVVAFEGARGRGGRMSR
jgi:hypothetical protein